MINITEVIKLYKKILLISIILFVCINRPYFSFADTVILNDGTELKGLIIENLEEIITLKIQHGGMETIKKEDIRSIKEEKIPVDLTLTREGVEDQWGSPVPPYLFDIEMALSIATNLEPESKYDYCKEYFFLAKEYEARVKSESIPELRQGGLITALAYYRIASKISDEAISKSGRLGVERCSAQLFNAGEEKVVIPYGPNMTEHINYFIKKLDSEAKKKAYTDLYLEMGQNYETKAAEDNSSEEYLKNIKIAMDCYGFAMSYSPHEEFKTLARRNLQRCYKKLTDGYIAKDDENLQESETVTMP